VEGLHRAGVDEKTSAALQVDVANTPVNEKEKALLLAAQAVTIEPERSHAAAQSAVAAGWTHDEVAEALFYASYFSMRVRIAHAFAMGPDARHPFDPAQKLPMLRCTR
jgi:alkylhydroperoxidase family enzyme